MPLTKQQLLIPRVLCIGGKEGKKNYPESDFITGQILSLHTHGVWYIQDEKDGYNEIQKFVVDEFLNCFKPLPWWYGRTVDEMPKYVKYKLHEGSLSYNSIQIPEYYGIYIDEGKGWGNEGDTYAVIKLIESTRTHDSGELITVNVCNLEPADESDYQEYQKQKEAK